MMCEKSPFSNRGLGLLVIFAKDIERAVAFYESLGLRFERHSHPPCGEHYASLGGDCVFEICRNRDGEPAMSPITFGFHVSHVDRAVEAAVEHGGALKRKPQTTDWGRSATVTDPDGNRVLLMEGPATANSQTHADLVGSDGRSRT
jgi:predicted enzyme related to lactoylglutathione lyase